MNVLIFEWLTCGGLLADEVNPDESCPFQKQGLGMFVAVATDATAAGHQVLSTRDYRMRPLDAAWNFAEISEKKELVSKLINLANQADAILIIAPESDGCLNLVLEWLVDHHQKLISPNPRFVKLTSDKQATSDWLAHHNVATTIGIKVATPFDARNRISLPVVIKPNQGAGSEHVQRIQSWDEVESIESNFEWRVESFVAGESVSVSVISDGRDHLLLTPTGQVFDRPLGHYIAALHPLDPALVSRATELAAQTVDALPSTCGYFGIDMILGESDGWVVDINPRLTMSYLALREIEPINLAQKMLEAGGVCPVKIQ